MESGKYALLKDILAQLELYETQSSGMPMDMLGFSLWLNQQMSYPNPGIVSSSQSAGTQDSDEQSESILTMLVSYLFRYTKFYSKKALEDTPLSTMDEFTFLASLSYQGSMTKTELIQQHLLEITSGIEIIKRLTKNGLLESFADPKDKRSKRVKLTAKGKEVLEEVMEKMDQVAHIVSGNLSKDEMTQLVPILHKLNDFHAVIHLREKKSELGEIVKKYL